VAFGGLLVAALLAWLLQVSLLGGAVHQMALALRGQAVPPLLEAVQAAARWALAWGVLAAAAVLAWDVWQLLLGGSSLLLFLRGLVLHSRSGVLGAAGLALAATVGPLLAVFLQLVAEMALVRCIARREPAAVAGWEAARTLLARPGAPLGLWVVTALLAAAVGGAAAGLASMAPVHSLRLRLPFIAVQMAVATLAASIALLVRLGAFLSLELGRAGELPGGAAPSRAELVQSEPILEARAVGPGPGTGP
jgi:hypothetical protein